MDVKSIEWAGARLDLLAEKALHWSERGILALSDVHLGKAHDFQAAGVPIPAGIHDEDLARLEALVLRLRPERVLILGDFVHSHGTPLDDLIASFRSMRESLAARWTLLVGNHDRRALKALAEWGFDEMLDSLDVGGVHFAHDVGEKPVDFTISGHVHPVIKLGRGRDRMRLPCFAVGQRRLILPSFGGFTGGFEIAPAKGERVFAIGEGQIVEI